LNGRDGEDGSVETTNGLGQKNGNREGVSGDSGTSVGGSSGPPDDNGGGSSGVLKRDVGIWGHENTLPLGYQGKRSAGARKEIGRRMGGSI